MGGSAYTLVTFRVSCFFFPGTLLRRKYSQPHLNVHGMVQQLEAWLPSDPLLTRRTAPGKHFHMLAPVQALLVCADAFY